MSDEFPEFCEWSIAAVRLLQGVVESEETRYWNLILGHRSHLEPYFNRIGLRVVIDESEGLAYLRQLSEEEAGPGYDSLPKLFRTTRLSYGQTLLSVLLRDALRRFEEEETLNERCVVEEAELLSAWQNFFPETSDDVKLARDLSLAFKRLEEMGFVKKFGDDPAAWEVRRILKARLTAEELESLLVQLRTTAASLETTSDTNS